MSTLYVNLTVTSSSIKNHFCTEENSNSENARDLSLIFKARIGLDHRYPYHQADKETKETSSIREQKVHLVASSDIEFHKIFRYNEIKKQETRAVILYKTIQK